MADLDLEALEEIMKVFLNKILIYNLARRKTGQAGCHSLDLAATINLGKEAR
jgi:hypothetical protein